MFCAPAVLLIAGLDQWHFGNLLRERPATLRHWGIYIFLGVLMIIGAIADGIDIWRMDVRAHGLRDGASQLEYELQ